MPYSHRFSFSQQPPISSGSVLKWSPSSGLTLPFEWVFLTSISAATMSSPRSYVAKTSTALTTSSGVVHANKAAWFLLRVALKSWATRRDFTSSPVVESMHFVLTYWRHRASSMASVRAWHGSLFGTPFTVSSAASGGFCVPGSDKFIQTLLDPLPLRISSCCFGSKSCRQELVFFPLGLGDLRTALHGQLQAFLRRPLE